MSENIRNKKIGEWEGEDIRNENIGREGEDIRNKKIGEARERI